MNILVLSEEEYERIEELAACNYSPDQIAKVLEVDIRDFRAQWLLENSRIRRSYDLGILNARAEIDQKLLAGAKSGNATAAQMYQNRSEANEFENLKRQFFFNDPG